MGWAVVMGVAMVDTCSGRSALGILRSLTLEELLRISRLKTFTEKNSKAEFAR